MYRYVVESEQAFSKNEKPIFSELGYDLNVWIIFKSVPVLCNVVHDCSNW